MSDTVPAITVPDGQPVRRFMRYVRPPIKDDEAHPPLYPLRPGTRALRLGIDVTTIPAPPPGEFSTFFGRNEIEFQLLVPRGSEIPDAWMDVLADPLVRQIGFTTIEEATRHLDTVEFWVATDSEHRRSRARAHFFPVYQQLDQQSHTQGETITVEQRNRAAAYAAAAAVVGIDVIVTAAPTVGRSDVADNDTVASVTPGDAVALIGHHLRMTNNPVVQVRSGRLPGGGTWTETESAATIENL
ncbi:hypothetical protein [Tsukamurella pseudospumae]|uniref:hypothetical protein n=1 Tax=Tsukamurella pseudospumae TaxID=239498 RepID=UPI000B2CD5FD|nr:hypothetical protein [Tsukamurella pseudospumae]